MTQRAARFILRLALEVFPLGTPMITPLSENSGLVWRAVKLINNAYYYIDLIGDCQYDFAAAAKIIC